MSQTRKDFEKAFDEWRNPLGGWPDREDCAIFGAKWMAERIILLNDPRIGRNTISVSRIRELEKELQ